VPIPGAGRRIAADTLDHPFIVKLVEGRHAFEAQTSAEILAALTPNDKTWHAPRGWPTSAQTAAGQLTRHAPALRAQGWEVSDDGGRNHRNVLRWTIRPPEDARTKASQSSQNNHNRTLEVIEAREDRRENNRRGEEESPRDGKRDDPRVRTEPSRLPQPSHAKAPRTCEDETASPARLEYGPSLAADDAPACTQPAANQFFEELNGRLLGGTNGDHAANTNGERLDPVLKTDTNPVPPGGLTNSTPGQTDRVQRALARAAAKASTVTNGQATGDSAVRESDG
jgi:hypothetical protein